MILQSARVQPGASRHRVECTSKSFRISLYLRERLTNTAQVDVSEAVRADGPKSSPALHGPYQAYPSGRIGSRATLVARFFGRRLASAFNAEPRGSCFLISSLLSSSRLKGRIGV